MWVFLVNCSRCRKRFFKYFQGKVQVVIAGKAKEDPGCCFNIFLAINYDALKVFLVQ